MLILGKYLKIRFKNRGSPYHFLSSGGVKIKSITKIEQMKLFVFTLLVSFFIAFLAQKLICTINIWFSFMFGSFFEQDCLLKLVSAIFIKCFFFNQIVALQKLWKMLFISSKKLFSFSRYSIFCISVLPSFSTCRPLL